MSDLHAQMSIDAERHAEFGVRLNATLRSAFAAWDCDHVWFWRSRLPERKGQPCRIWARGRMNSIGVEFSDGHRVITSRYAVRQREASQ